MDRIDELIKYYEDRKNNKDKDEALIRANLKYIKDLQWSVDDPEDFIFITRIMETFCEIIETQCSVIDSLREYMAEDFTGGVSVTHNYMGSKISSADEIQWTPDAFECDAQLQGAFTRYCIANGKSSYTVNDYCSRIKKLWKIFYEDYTANTLPGGLTREDVHIVEDSVDPANPLMNVLYFTEQLITYITVKIISSGDDRSLANTRAALNKFDKFKNPQNYKK